MDVSTLGVHSKERELSAAVALVRRWDLRDCQNLQCKKQQWVKVPSQRELSEPWHRRTSTSSETRVWAQGLRRLGGQGSDQGQLQEEGEKQRKRKNDQSWREIKKKNKKKGIINSPNTCTLIKVKRQFGDLFHC